MTLAMTAITPQVVVQLADMRLTNIRTGTVVDEATAKLVSYLGRFSFAFTGPACVNRTPTAEWIATILRQHADPSEAPLALARAADRALAAYEPALKRYAIVGGGWLSTGRSDRPVYVEITNWDSALGLLPRSRAEIVELSRSEKVGLFWGGVPVPDDLRRETLDLLRRRARSREARPVDLLGTMARAARIVAQTNLTVGRRDFLVSAIPGSGSGALFRRLSGDRAEGASTVPVIATLGADAVSPTSLSGPEAADAGSAPMPAGPCV